MILGALADDLTGGLELAAMLAAEGVPTRLSTSAEAIGPVASGGAVVIAQKTRIAPVAEARALVAAGARALRDAGARRLFFKYCATFDSTPIGNIGPCIDELLDLTGSDFTACCPTFPEYRRTVYQGHLFVGDRLMSESPKRLDPVTPMTDADLVRVLQPQTARRVGLIGLETVRSGAEAIQRHCADLRAAGVGCAIADAVMHEDLQNLARATVDWPLMTGGSSVAAHYPALWRELGWLGPAAADHGGLPAVEGPGVVLAGSCADQTRAQLRYFAASHPLLDLDIEAALQGRDVVGPAIAWAGERLPRGPVGVRHVGHTRSGRAPAVAMGRGAGRGLLRGSARPDRSGPARSRRPPLRDRRRRNLGRGAAAPARRKGHRRPFRRPVAAARPR